MIILEAREKWLSGEGVHKYYWLVYNIFFRDATEKGDLIYSLDDVLTSMSRTGQIPGQDVQYETFWLRCLRSTQYIYVI